MTTTSPTSSVINSTETALSVNGMDCASCVAHVEKAARAVAGVRTIQVNLARGRAVVDFDPDKTTADAIAAAITDGGYPTTPEAPAAGAAAESERLQRQAEHARQWLWRAIVAGVLWLPFELLHWIVQIASGGHAHHHLWMHWLTLITSTVAIIYAGGGFYSSAIAALRRRTSNMDTLIAMGVTVAYAYSLVAFAGYLLHWWTTLPNLYFMEATGLLALISLGHYLEARARRAAGSAIHQLLDLAPSTALRVPAPQPQSPRSLNVLSGAAAEPAEVPVAQLHLGDHILVRPGDRVPTDAVIVDGTSTVDESMLTGEPLPVTRTAGDTVIGGTINHDGRLIARVTKLGSETALARIVQLVETAQNSKPPVQHLADKIAAIFVPSVLVIALITAIGWFAWGTAHHWPAAETWGKLANAVCSVLLIACPCALGLAVPAALMVGTGRGAKRGILIRDIDALQHAERIDTVVLDKTGTVTRGRPVVTIVISLDGTTDDQLLRIAASAEQSSEHPLAQAIVAYARGRNIAIAPVTAFTNHPGRGIRATIDGATYLVGHPEFTGAGRALPPSVSAPGAPASTTVHISRLTGPDAIPQPLGHLALSDEIKPDSAAAVTALHTIGLRTVLLTGDNAPAARAVAAQAGIDDVRADVLPAGKADAIRQLQAGGAARVAMVGDGINDAPALAAADLGIAIGTGSDIAKETGDIVLVSGSLAGVPTAIKLSRATMRVIRQNLFFAFLYNVLAIPLAAFGVLSPLIAAAAMALSDVTVLGNALRLRDIDID